MAKRTKKPRLLILGGSSLLAYLLSKEADKKFEILLTKNKREINYMNYKIMDINLYSSDTLSNSLYENGIDIVLNTIGLTNVERCEAETNLAYELNTFLPRKIAQACKKNQSKLIHISTDHLFGNEDKMFTEKDEVKLMNTYAKSKYEGEIEVLSSFPSALICRTNFFGYGPPHKESMSDWIINSIKNKKQISLFNDVSFTPVEGKFLAKIIHKLLDFNCKGIYNISSDKKITKYEFGLNLCKNLNLPNTFIKSISIKERLDLIQRPLSMALSNKKLTDKIKYNVGSIDKHLLNI